MRNRSISLVFSILLVCLLPQTSQPCTTFCLDHGDQPIFGKNYDWAVEDGLAIINKRGVSKTALPSSGTDFGRPARWTSKYGSITFNQYGRELPMGGMNEAGLVVESMMLAKTEYPAPDSRPSISSLQWIQYQLDNFSKVEEVIASDSQLRIRPERGPGIHYLVCDRMGECASVEFLHGNMVVHTNKTMPVKTLTNSTYAESIEYLKRHDGFGGELPILGSENSLDRFGRAASMVKNYDPKTQQSAVGYAFDILKDVRSYLATQWSIVYDIQNLGVHFRTLRNQQIRYIDLKPFDLACAKPVKVLHTCADLSGDVTDNFIDYTQEINRNLIGNAFRKTDFLNNVPEESLDNIARYPESTVCTR